METLVTRLLQVSPLQRLLALVGLLAILGLAFYFLIYSGRAEDITRLRQSLARVRGEVSRTRTVARQLPVLEKRLASNTQQLRLVSRFLPDTEEIPELLIQVSDMGRSAGLDFLLFQPEKEEPRTFYAAVPVKLQISGTFSQIMTFFRGLSELPRVVDVTDLKIGDADVQPGRVNLKIGCLTTTFRFLKDQELKEAAQKSGPRGARMSPGSARRPARARAGG